jgi:hypothetical protein
MGLEETRYQILVRNWDAEYTGVIDTWQSLSYLKVPSDIGYIEVKLTGDSDAVDLFDLDYILEVWRKPAGYPWAIETRGFWRGCNRELDGMGHEVYTAVVPTLEHLLTRRIVLQWRKTYGYLNPDAILELYPGQMLYQLYDMSFSSNYVTMEDWYYWGWQGSREAPRVTMTDPGTEGNDVKVDVLWRSVFDVAQELAGHASGGDFSVTMEGTNFVIKWHDGGLGIDRTIGNANDVEPVVFGQGLGNIREPLYELDRTSEATACYKSRINKKDRLRVGFAPSSPEEAADYGWEDSPWNRIEVYRAAGTGGNSLQLLRKLAPIEAFTFWPIESEASRYGVHYGLGDKVSMFWGPTFTTRADKRISAVKCHVDQHGEDLRIEVSDVT